MIVVFKNLKESQQDTKFKNHNYISEIQETLQS